MSLHFFFVVLKVYFIIQLSHNYVTVDSMTTEITYNITNTIIKDVGQTEAMLELNSTHRCSERSEKIDSTTFSENETTLTSNYSTNSATTNEISNETINTTSASESPKVSTSTETTVTESEFQTATIKATSVVFATHGSSNTNTCTIRVGLFWRKVNILAEHARFNANKCELQYCTPSLEIEPFTCKNLLAIIVPPVSTEEMINEWKLECVKNKCIPAD